MVNDNLKIARFCKLFKYYSYVQFMKYCSLVKYIFIVGLWVGWPGLDVNDMVFENVPESDPDDTSPTAGLK